MNDKELYSDFMDLVEKRLKKHNQLLTKNKKTVLDILYDQKEHLSVEEIVEHSKSHKKNSLSLTTVYRIISTLESFGIVESLLVKDKKRYELSYQKKPHYHLYCQECCNIYEFSSCDIERMFSIKLKQMEFKAATFNVMINGVCKNCISKK